MADGDVVRLDFGGSIENIDVAEAVSEQMSRLAGLDDEELHRVGLAVRETVINAIKHGNCNDVAKRVYLEFTLLSGKEAGVHIRVRDEGCGFDPASLSDPLKSENIFKPSGRGIFLIRSLMDELAFEKTPRGGTEVVMVKRSARVDRPEPQTSG